MKTRRHRKVGSIFTFHMAAPAGARNASHADVADPPRRVSFEQVARRAGQTGGEGAP